MHEFLSPSSAARWVQCALSASISAAYPQPATPESIEGEAFHWLCNETIRGYPDVNIATGATAPNGVRITEEMQEGLEVVLGAVGEKLDLKDRLHVEETIKNASVHPLHNGGTPDLWTFNYSALDVFDWKYGHERVDEFENWQLLNYACLILEWLKAAPPLDESIIVRLHVVQPRCYSAGGPHRTWTLKGSDIRAYRNILVGAAERAMQPSPPATTGPECIHCPGRRACSAFQRSAGRAIDLSERSTPLDLPPEAVGAELRMLWAAQDRLKARITGLEEQAEHLLRHGQQVPHVKLEPTSGREVWIKPLSEVIMAGTLMGFDLNKPAAITPTQARKLGMSPDIVATYAGREKTGMKLVLDDGSAARKVFK